MEGLPPLRIDTELELTLRMEDDIRLRCSAWTCDPGITGMLCCAVLTDRPSDTHTCPFFFCLTHYREHNGPLVPHFRAWHSFGCVRGAHAGRKSTFAGPANHIDWPHSSEAHRTRACGRAAASPASPMDRQDRVCGRRRLAPGWTDEARHQREQRPLRLSPAPRGRLARGESHFGGPFDGHAVWAGRHACDASPWHGAHKEEYQV